MLATSAVSLSEPWIDDGTSYWHESAPPRGAAASWCAAVRGPRPSTSRRRGPQRSHPGARVRRRRVGVARRCRGLQPRRRPTPVPPGPRAGRPCRSRPRPMGCIDTPMAASRRAALLDRGPRTAPGVRARVAEVVNELVARAARRRDRSRRSSLRATTSMRCPASPRTARGLSWLSWNLPWMPWDGCELWVADLGADGSLADARSVAGRDGEESIWQPAWSPAGDLVFASDRSGWWNLERLHDGHRERLHEAEAEFGYPAVGVRRVVVRVLRRRPHRVLVRRSRCAASRAARPRDPRVARSRPAATRVRVRPRASPRRAMRSRRSPGPPTSRARSCGSTSARGRSRCSARASSLRSTRRTSPSRGRSSSPPTAGARRSRISTCRRTPTCRRPPTSARR